MECPYALREEKVVRAQVTAGKSPVSLDSGGCRVSWIKCEEVADNGLAFDVAGS